MCKWGMIILLCGWGLCPNTALAEYPNWDDLQLSFADVEINNKRNSSFDGYASSGIESLADNFFFAGRYVDDLILNSNIKSTSIVMLSTGAGYQYAFNDSTSIFALLSYEFIEAGVYNSPYPENEVDRGMSATIGVRSMLTNSVELNSSIGYIELDFLGDSNIDFNISTYYYLTDKFSVGVGYRTLETIDSVRGSVRYSF